MSGSRVLLARCIVLGDLARRLIDRARVSLQVGGCLVVLWAPLGALAAQLPQDVERAGAADASEQAESPAAESTEEVQGAGGVEGELDVEWLTDEKGRRYYLEAMPKESLGKFQRLDGNRLRTPWGFRITFESEDEKHFYLRHYDVQYEPPDTEPTAEERAAVAESYRFELPVDDRLVFASFDEGLPRRGQWRQGFDVADMNGDGHPDLVHGTPRKFGDLPVVFLGDGAGKWELWNDAVFPAHVYDYGDVAVADFDGDGRQDLALGNHLRGQVVLVQAEPGKFALWTEGVDFDPLAKGSAFTSRSVAAADWDGDGRPDVLALGEGPILRIQPTGPQSVPGSFGLVLYRNLGDGTWERHASQVGPDEGFGDALELADLNQDGRLDVVRGTLLAGQTTLLYMGEKGGGWEIEDLPGLRPNSYIRGVAVADFDADGRQDIALTYAAYEIDRWHYGIDLLRGTADGSFERRTVYAEEEPRGLWAIDAGDLDGDGEVDLVALAGDGEVLVLLGAGGGRFVREAEDLVTPADGCRGYDVHLVDLDGDGRDEIAAAFAGEPSGLLGTTRLPGCPGEGSLRVWRAGSGEPTEGLDTGKTSTDG